MKSKFNHLPLKAYEVYENEDDWRGLSKEYVYGVFVGHTAGQARAQVATDRMSGGCTNPWPYLRSRRVHGEAADLAIERHEDRRKHWKDTRQFARLQAQADAFNAANPVGTPVRIGCYVGTLAPIVDTVTRTPAWVTAGLQLLVSVEGYNGGYSLNQIEVLAATPHLTTV